MIPKILIENLIDNGFSVKEMSNISCVSESTVLRRMVEYDLKMKIFSNSSDDQLYSDVLAKRLSILWKNCPERTFERETNKYSALSI